MFSAVSQLMTDSTTLMFTLKIKIKTVVRWYQGTFLNCHHWQVVRRLSTSLAWPGRVPGSTSTAGTTPLRGSGNGREPRRTTRGWDGLLHAPTSTGRHFLERSFPRALQASSLPSACLGRSFLVRTAWRYSGSPASEQSPSPGAGRGRGRQGAGPRTGPGEERRAARPSRGSGSAAPLAPPFAPPAREPGRGRRGQEAASAPGSAAAAVGVVGAAEPALRAAAAGAGGRDKDDGKCSAGPGRAPAPTPRSRGPLGRGPKPRIPAAEGSGGSAARPCPSRAAGCVGWACGSIFRSGWGFHTDPAFGFAPIPSEKRFHAQLHIHGRRASEEASRQPM